MWVCLVSAFFFCRCRRHLLPLAILVLLFLILSVTFNLTSWSVINVTFEFISFDILSNWKAFAFSFDRYSRGEARSRKKVVGQILVKKAKLNKKKIGINMLDQHQQPAIRPNKTESKIGFCRIDQPALKLSFFAIPSRFKVTDSKSQMISLCSPRRCNRLNRSNFSFRFFGAFCGIKYYPAKEEKSISHDYLFI